MQFYVSPMPGIGPIYLDNVGCTGSEGRVVDCIYDSHTLDCGHDEDIGVRCQGECVSV